MRTLIRLAVAAVVSAVLLSFPTVARAGASLLYRWTDPSKCTVRGTLFPVEHRYRAAAGRATPAPEPQLSPIGTS